MKLPMMTGDEVVAALKRAGFMELRQKGSHKRLGGPSGERVTVAVHAGRTIPRKTLASILDQAGMTEEQFFRLL